NPRPVPRRRSRSVRPSVTRENSVDTSPSGTPAPWSRTDSSTLPESRARPSTTTGARPWTSPFSTRLATTCSSRRGSASAARPSARGRGDVAHASHAVGAPHREPERGRSPHGLGRELFEAARVTRVDRHEHIAEHHVVEALALVAEYQRQRLVGVTDAAVEV